jgi:hypothetical protein
MEQGCETRMLCTFIWETFCSALFVCDEACVGPNIIAGDIVEKQDPANSSPYRIPPIN